MPEKRENINRMLQQKTYEAKAALIVYSSGRHLEEEKWGVYAEIRPIVNGRLSAGHPVSKKAMHDLLGAFDKQDKDQTALPAGVIPQNMLYADLHSATYVWYTKPGRRLVLFEAKNMATDEYAVPGMVYKLSGDRLAVWAFKGTRPTMETPLLHAPFFNVYESGNVCLGSARHKIEGPLTWEKIVEHGETLFWSSRGSHTIYWPSEYPQSKKENDEKRPPRKYPSPKEMYGMFKDRPFDASILIPTDRRLKDIIK